MAPRKKYSNACIAEAAAKAAADAKSKLPNAIAIQHLSCEHLVDASSADVKRNAPVKFRWRIQHGVYDAAAEVEVLCHNVVNKGVPLPEHWHTAMQFLALSDIATSSARKVCDARFTDVRCVLLGQAAAKFGSRGRVGQSIALNVGGERTVFLLCCHVENNDWLCHRGSFADGALAANPFHEHDLVCKNIVKDA